MSRRLVVVRTTDTTPVNLVTNRPRCPDRDGRSKSLLSLPDSTTRTMMTRYLLPWSDLQVSGSVPAVLPSDGE